MSTARAIVDNLNDWYNGSKELSSMGVYSDG